MLAQVLLSISTALFQKACFCELDFPSPGGGVRPILRPQKDRRISVCNRASRDGCAAVVGMRSLQTPGKSGGEAGTAALTSARAACKAASLVWSREVFSTVPPSPLSPSSTLSAVTLRTNTKSAAVPG